MNQKSRTLFAPLFGYIFVAIPAMLFGTALVVGGYVIPLQILTVFAGGIALSQGVSMRSVRGPIIWFLTVCGLLLIGAFVRTSGELDANDVKQLAMRILFALYCLSLFAYFGWAQNGFYRAVPVTLTTLRFLFLYGIYELVAKMWGFPLFLAPLSNNPSYSNAINVTSEMSGWIEFYRAQSVWPEPSFAIFPILLFWVLSDREGLKVKQADLVIMLIFAAATFSRTVWLGVFVLILMRLLVLRRNAIFISFALIFSILMAMFGSFSQADHSASVRSQTTLYGFELATTYPFWGLVLINFEKQNMRQVLVKW